MRALESQARLFGGEGSIHTIYFGGGTPSLVPAHDYESLFQVVSQSFSVDADAEITLEANPGTVDMQLLEAYRKVGFNRISFGMQSVVESELHLLDRAHTPEDVTHAVDASRNAGFDNINLDMIFGLPGQTLQDWQRSLKAAVSLSPEHLSLYSLIVEDGTPLANDIDQGCVAPPDDDMAAEQYEWSCRYLQEAGFTHYEISNWAKIEDSRDLRCRHNLQYWRLQPYYGLGCGAVGFLPAGSSPFSQGVSVLMQNENWISRYITQLEKASRGKTPSDFLDGVNLDYEMNTFMFTGFRLLEEGVDRVEFTRRFGAEITDIFGTQIDRLTAGGLIETGENGNPRLTRSAWLVANRVFREFAGEE